MSDEETTFIPRFSGFRDVESETIALAAGGDGPRPDAPRPLHRNQHEKKIALRELVDCADLWSERLVRGCGVVAVAAAC